MIDSLRDLQAEVEAVNKVLRHDQALEAVAALADQLRAGKEAAIVANLFQQAAERITALEAENERLRESQQGLIRIDIDHQDKANLAEAENFKLRAENAKFREALREILMDSAYHRLCSECQRAINEALSTEREAKP